MQRPTLQGHTSHSAPDSISADLNRASRRSRTNSPMSSSSHQGRWLAPTLAVAFQSASPATTSSSGPAPRVTHSRAVRAQRLPFRLGLLSRHPLVEAALFLCSGRINLMPSSQTRAQYLESLAASPEWRL